MKYLAVILSIYALLLTIVPCADACSYADNSAQTELVSQQMNQVDQEHSDHTDQCSPFCSCTCCQVIVSLLHTQVKIAPSPNRVFYHSFRQGNVNLFQFTHFRPPIV